MAGKKLEDPRDIINPDIDVENPPPIEEPEDSAPTQKDPPSSKKPQKAPTDSDTRKKVEIISSKK